MPEITKVFGLDIEGMNIDNHYCMSNNWHEAGLHRKMNWTDMDETMIDLIGIVLHRKDTKWLISQISIGMKAGAAYVIHLLPLSDDLVQLGDIPKISSVGKNRHERRSVPMRLCGSIWTHFTHWLCSINRLFLMWGISNDKTDFREMLSLDLIESPGQWNFWKKLKTVLQGQIQVLDLQPVVGTMYIPWVSAYEGDPDAKQDPMMTQLDFATGCCVSCLMNKRVVSMLLQESIQGPTKGAGMEPTLLACHKAPGK